MKLPNTDRYLVMAGDTVLDSYVSKVDAEIRAENSSLVCVVVDQEPDEEDRDELIRS